MLFVKGKQNLLAAQEMVEKLRQTMQF